MKRFIIAMALCVASLGAYCQVPLWENLYPSTSWIIALTQLRDSTLVSTGGKEQQPIFPARLVRFDRQGNNIWQKNGISAFTGEQDIKQAANGKLIYATSKRRFYPDNTSDDYLQQYDAATGDTLTTWSKWFATDHITEFTCEMVLMENGDIVTAGMAIDDTPLPSPDNGFNFYTLRRTDSLGNELWYRRFGKGINTYGTRLLKNQAGNFVLAGMVRRSPGGGLGLFHPFLIEVSPSGDSIQGKRLVIKNENLFEEVGRLFNNIIQTADGNYVFSGRLQVTGQFPTAFVAEVDQQFNLLWYYEYDTNILDGVNGKKVMELPDSTLLFMVHDWGNPQPTGFHLIRISKDGQFASKQTLVSSACSQGRVIPDNWVLLPDKSLVICGRCEGTNPRQGYIGRWGNLNLGPLTAAELPLAASTTPALGQSYPNPASNSARIPYELPTGATQAAIEIRELVTGRLLAQYPLTPAAGKAWVEVSLEKFGSGNYVYSLRVNEATAGTGKLVVVK